MEGLEVVEGAQRPSCLISAACLSSGPVQFPDFSPNRHSGSNRPSSVPIPFPRVRWRLLSYIILSVKRFFLFARMTG